MKHYIGDVPMLGFDGLLKEDLNIFQHPYSGSSNKDQHKFLNIGKREDMSSIQLMDTRNSRLNPDITVPQVVVASPTFYMLNGYNTASQLVLPRHHAASQFILPSHQSSASQFVLPRHTAASQYVLPRHQNFEKVGETRSFPTNNAPTNLNVIDYINSNYWQPDDLDNMINDAMDVFSRENQERGSALKESHQTNKTETEESVGSGSSRSSSILNDNTNSVALSEDSQALDLRSWAGKSIDVESNNEIIHLNPPSNRSPIQNFIENFSNNINLEEKSEPAFIEEAKINAKATTTRAESQLVKCDECHKLFNTGKYLSQHKIAHHSELKDVCQKCNKKFLTAEKLESHMLTHNNDHKRFSCKACPRKFSSNQSLKRHQVSIHKKDELRYQCSYCSMRGDRKDHMIRHEMMHVRKQKKKLNKKPKNKK